MKWTLLNQEEQNYTKQCILHILKQYIPDEIIIRRHVTFSVLVSEYEKEKEYLCISFKNNILLYSQIIKIVDELSLLMIGQVGFKGNCDMIRIYFQDKMDMQIEIQNEKEKLIKYENQFEKTKQIHEQKIQQLQNEKLIDMKKEKFREHQNEYERTRQKLERKIYILIEHMEQAMFPLSLNGNICK